jgi:hypothetical protein
MNEETLAQVMHAIDPARDLSDEALAELFPPDRLMERIHAGIEQGVPELRHMARTPIWRRVPALIGAGVAASAVAIVAVVSLLGSSPVALQALNPVHGVSTYEHRSAIGGTTYSPVVNGGVTFTSAGAAIVPCQASALDETLLFPPSLHTLSNGFQGRIRFVNLGPACYLRETFVGIEAVTGPSYSIVSSSTAPSVAYSGIIRLSHGRAATASISVASSIEPGLPPCIPKGANGLVLLPMFAGWPSTYFALPSATPVCTSGHLVNIAGGLLAKEDRSK